MNQHTNQNTALHPLQRPVRRGVLFFVLFFLIVLLAAGVRMNVAHKHCFPAGDEGPWLRLAARAGTPQFLVSKVIEHDYYLKSTLPHPEDNRSPLFPILIRAGSLFNRDMLRAGQLTNIALFLVLFVCFGVLLRNRFGRVQSLCTMLFIAVSPIFIVLTSNIYDDVLVGFGFMLFLMTADTIPLRRRNSCLGGVLLGLLFLLKSTAVFLLPAVLYFFVMERKQRDSIPRLGLFVLCFSALAAPWMLRNQIVFGSPLYQYTKYVLFCDNMAQSFAVGVPRPTLGLYLHAHGMLFTFVTRPLVGLRHLGLQILTHDHNLTPALLPLALFGVYRMRHERKFWAAFAVLSAPYLALMGYTAYGFWVDRYLLVYYLTIYMLAGAGIGFLVSFIRLPAMRVVALLLLAAGPLCVVARPMEYYLSSRGGERQRDADARLIIGEMKGRIPESAAVVSSFLYGYCFLHDLRVVNAIGFGTPEKFGMLARRYRISYALLDRDADQAVLALIDKWAGKDNVELLGSRGPFSWYCISSDFNRCAPSIPR